MAGLYIHVPYCHSKCIYCDFYSTPGHRHDGWASRYVDAVIAEWHRRRVEITEPFETIYIGGGTPSVLPANEIKRLTSAIDLDGITEFTIEVNPEDVNREMLTTLSTCGVNRLSMGIQTFDDDTLKLIGRRHRSADAIAAIAMMRDAGFSNISGDIIYGLPGQTIEDWMEQLDRLMALDLPHFSAYLLSYEPGTRLILMRDRGSITEADEELASEMYRHLIMTAAANGYDHYEISNFGRHDHHAIHNTNYWKGIPYLGLGPGAHSFDGNTRRFNPPNISRYLADGGTDITEVEEETSTDRINDEIITALRTAEGLDLDRFSHETAGEILEKAKAHLDNGYIVRRDRHIAIPEKYFLISDRIMIDLML